MRPAIIGLSQRRLAVPLLLVLLAAAAGGALLHSGNTQTPPQPATPTGSGGSFKPSEEQWKALTIESVATRSFRTERVTEGNIALDDDLNTPVFSPYSGRVTRLIAKLGDKVERGAPLFTVEATEFVQAANDLIAAVFGTAHRACPADTGRDQ